MSDMRGSLDLREEPPRRRMARWNEALSGAFAVKTCRALAEGPYEARMHWRSWANGLTVAQIHAAPAYIEHPLSHGSGARGRDFLIHFQLEGKTLNCQDGRDALLLPGDFTLCDTGRPYAIRFDAPARVLVFRLPSERVERVLPDAEELVATRIAGDRGGGALFSAFAMRLAGEFEDEAIAGAADELPDAILSLVALARPSTCIEGADIAANPLLWRRVRAFVQAHLTDEALGVNMIAAYCGVSTRYIQKVFAMRGHTPTSYILQRRLRLAAMQLRDGRNGEKGVLDIAHSVGFRDLSYFNRTFRSKFGATPSQFRRSL